MKFSADLKVGQARLVRKVDLQEISDRMCALKDILEPIVSRNRDGMIKSDVAELESVLKK